MKVLVLFDLAQRSDPEEKFTPESLREQNKPTEACVMDCLQRLGHQVETLAERVASLCLADPRSVSVIVGVEKLDVYSEAESVGVSVMRRRGG